VLRRIPHPFGAKLLPTVTGGTYSADAHKVTVREIAERWRKAKYSPRRADALRSTTSADYETTLTLYILNRL